MTRNLQWGDSSNDPGLSENFAWLINVGIGWLINVDNPAEDACAVIDTDKSVFNWTVSLSEPTASGFIPNDKDVHGTAVSMEEAKRQCEKVLGLNVCPQHEPINRKVWAEHQIQKDKNQLKTEEKIINGLY